MSLFKIKQQEVMQSVSVSRGVVHFFVSGKDYAVDIGAVREVIYGRKISPLPGAPDYFEGLIDLRGTVVPVIHLGKRLQATPSGIRPEGSGLTHILIVEIDHKKVGFVVDHVEDVVTLGKESVQPADNFIESPLPVIEGVFRYNDRLILLLDLERLFSAAVLHQITEAMGRHAA